MAASFQISQAISSSILLHRSRTFRPPSVNPLRSPRFSVSASARTLNSEKASVRVLPAFAMKKGRKMLDFVKYEGLGNDFVVVDNRDSLEPKVTAEQAMWICDRNFGVGADGVIFLLSGINGTDYCMRIFNSDGSEPEMCGNGIRCFARYIVELEHLSGKQSFTIQTGAGLIIAEIQENGKVRVDMGPPIVKASDVPTRLQPNKDEMVVNADLKVGNMTWKVTCVSMGNPHCVTFGTEDNQALRVDDLHLEEIGPKFENHEMFPSRTNTEFVEVLSPTHLKMRVWERGAGATFACGTGACAVVVAAVLTGRSERNCVVKLPGGDLEIEWNKDDNHVYMTGDAKAVYYGSVPL